MRSEHAGVDLSILVLPDPTVATTYALFLQAPSGALAAGEPSHAELLIDRNGYIRARWLSAADASDNAIAELQRASERANALPPAESDTPPHPAHC